MLNTTANSNLNNSLLTSSSLVQSYTSVAETACSKTTTSNHLSSESLANPLLNRSTTSIVNTRLLKHTFGAGEKRDLLLTVQWSCQSMSQITQDTRMRLTFLRLGDNHLAQDN